MDTKNKQNDNKSKKKKPIYVILGMAGAVLIIVGLIAATSNSGSATDAGANTYTVERGDLTVTVTEGGSIRARNSIEYKCQVERRSQTMIMTIVPQGTYITQEDVDNDVVLIELDPSTLKESLLQEEMELASDQESYTAAQESYQIQVKQNESDIADGEMRVRFALMDLQKYLGKELANDLVKDVNDVNNLSEYISPKIERIRQDPNLLAGSMASQELKKLKDNIVLAQGNLATSQATLDGTIKLHDANYVSDLDLQRDELTLMNRKFSAESAGVELDLYLEYDFPKSAEQDLSNYIEYNRQLDRTYASCRSKIAQSQARLSNAKERLSSQKTYVEELNQQIENCTIRAKAPGLVVYGTGSGDALRAMRGRGGGSTSSGIIAEGEAVSEGQTLISMPDTAEMVAEIGIHETEIDKIRVGQPAMIVFDAFPDKTLEGEVIEVAPLPDESRGWMNPDLKVYKTLILIHGQHEFLKTGNSCRATIYVDHLTDVIKVPITVVANRGGKKVVYIANSSNPKETDVTTGLFNDMFVHITEGLEEGDMVLVNPPLTYDQTAEVTMTEGQQKLLENVNQTPKPTNGFSKSAAGVPGGGFDAANMSDEKIDGMLQGLKQMDPAKYEELTKLRSEDPEKFKKAIDDTIKEYMQKMPQGGMGSMGGGMGSMGGGSPQGSQGRQRRQGTGQRQGGGGQ